MLFWWHFNWKMKSNITQFVMHLALLFSPNGSTQINVWQSWERWLRLFPYLVKRSSALNSEGNSFSVCVCNLERRAVNSTHGNEGLSLQRHGSYSLGTKWNRTGWNREELPELDQLETLVIAKHFAAVCPNEYYPLCWPALCGPPSH